MTDERTGTRRDDEREKDGGGKEGKDGNEAHTVSMLSAARAKLYSLDTGRTNEKKGASRDSDGGGRRN